MACRHFWLFEQTLRSVGFEILADNPLHLRVIAVTAVSGARNWPTVCTDSRSLVNAWHRAFASGNSDPFFGVHAHQSPLSVARLPTQRAPRYCVP